MSIEIKFSCNICPGEYIREDGKNKIPVGWGAIRPTLRVTMPPWDESTREQWHEMRNARDELKAKLQLHEYHLCPDCLQTAQKNILKLEAKKKRTKR